MALAATLAVLVAPSAVPDIGPSVRHQCRAGIITACIDRAAWRWRVDRWMLRRKAWCESRNDPRAVNAQTGASGLFQFLPSTWQRTPYRRRSIWSAEWNAMAAAWMHHMGRGGEWACR
jgi:soluble lytic murein transglycosylase-like protein